MRSVNPNTGIKGMDIVLANLNREIVKIKRKSTKGLIESAILIRRAMDKTSPLIPVDIGNLRASWFVISGTKVEKGGGAAFKGKKAGQLATGHASIMSQYTSIASAIPMPVVIMGFSANYAMFVHEMVDANFTGDQSKIKRTKGGKATQSTKKYTRRVGAGSKFLQSALFNNQREILSIIARNAKIN